MKKISLFIIISILTVGILFFSNDKSKILIKSFLPLETKMFLKDLLQRNDYQDNKIQNNFDRLYDLESKVAILEHKLNDHDLNEQINKFGYYTNGDSKKIALEDGFRLQVWDLPFFSWNINEKMTSYIESANGIFYLTTGDGFFYKGYLDELNEGLLKIYPVKTNLENITSLIDLRKIYQKQSSYSHAISIKDTLLFDDHLYVSLVDKLDDNCYMTSILKTKINPNSDNFNFDYFFKPNFCLKNEKNTALIISGGALSVNQEKNELYLSIGDYRHWDKASDPKNILGKIISFNIKSGKYEIYTSGHRNPLGFYFDNKEEILLSTEMGPHYGDEINLLIKNKNYGWPSSSYGLHYSDYSGDHPLANLVKLAPLHKSHDKFGYQEPLFSFSPHFDRKNPMLEKLVGGPALKNIENNIFTKNSKNYLVFGMKSKKIYFFEYSKEFKLKSTLNLGYRIRDVKSFNSYYLLTEENKPSLILLKKNN